MPELPEVETVVRDLRKTQPPILGAEFLDVWTDFEKIVKRPKNFEKFRNEIKRKRIKNIWRRGKNILFDLSEDKTLLIHQKLTGHLLLGRWKKTDNKWKPPPGPLSEKINTYIHLLFTLDNGQMLALSDLRKFAKVGLLNQGELKKELSSLGPEPLKKSFTFEKFKEAMPKRGKIKQVLMDQKVIAGIGNFYSDEILWEAKIDPFRDVSKLKEKNLREIFKAMKKILSLAIKLGGESISDFRKPSGEKGYYDRERKVYRREGEKCFRCSGVIKRIKIGGRNAHFCPKCQK